MEFVGELSLREVFVAALDIFIVYYIIYRVLLTIKGTRAAQMVIGVLVIGVGFFLAQRLEMATVSWLLDGIISYFIIIVVIVFQQDIRRALVRLGKNVVPAGRTHALAHALDEVIAAANHLAKARIGGIVVFEREADIDEFIVLGQVVDALVSRRLLVSLFVPSRNNELHDGAIVIDKNLRVRRAGGVLPLSTNPNLAREFGTRYRAALGITEETDAVALVISEERGEMSVCFKGSIARDLEPERLRVVLQGLFYQDKRATQMADEAYAAAQIGKAIAAIATKPEGVNVDSPKSISSPVGHHV